MGPRGEEGWGEGCVAGTQLSDDGDVWYSALLAAFRVRPGVSLGLCGFPILPGGNEAERCSSQHPTGLCIPGEELHLLSVTAVTQVLCTQMILSELELREILESRADQ